MRIYLFTGHGTWVISQNKESKIVGDKIMVFELFSDISASCSNFFYLETKCEDIGALQLIYMIEGDRVKIRYITACFLWQ